MYGGIQNDGDREDFEGGEGFVLDSRSDSLLVEDIQVLPDQGGN